VRSRHAALAKREHLLSARDCEWLGRLIGRARHPSGARAAWFIELLAPMLTSALTPSSRRMPALQALWICNLLRRFDQKSRISGVLAILCLQGTNQ
jgi:hypothetical protein